MISSFLESIALSLSFLFITDNTNTINIIIIIINISIGMSVKVKTFIFRRTPVTAALAWMVEPVKLVLPAMVSDANVCQTLVPLEVIVRLVCIHQNGVKIWAVCSLISTRI